MDEDSNKAVIRRFIEEFLNTGDPEIADKILASDCIDHTPSNPKLARLVNIKQFVNEWLTAFPDSHNVVKDMVTEGDKVAAR